jgi:hypothetical protein
MRFANYTSLIGGVVTILGLNRESFKEWLHRGYVKASINERQGNRVLRRFSFFDILLIEIFRVLIGASFSRTKSHLLIKLLRKNKSDVLSDSTSYIAFFDWPMGRRYFPDWPQTKIEGKPAKRPFFRVISAEDTQKSFFVLFESLTDVEPFVDGHTIPFNWIFILNVKEQIEAIEDKIAAYEKAQQ